MTDYGKTTGTVLTLVFLCILVTAAAPKSNDFSYSSIEEAIARAQSELEGVGDSIAAEQFKGCGAVANPLKPSARWAAIVIKYSYSDDFGKSAEMRINAHSKNRGMHLPPDTARVYFVYVDTKQIKFRLSQQGYHTIEQTFDVSQGEIRIIDDLILERVTERNSPKVFGRVWLEDETNLDGIEVRGGRSKTITDKCGRFQLDRIPAGELNILAKKPGYVFQMRRINVRRDARRVIIQSELKGYLKRDALVRWAFQPNGTRDFSGDLKAGLSLLGGELWTRIRFDRGFTLKEIHYDFEMIQRDDKLLIKPASGVKDTGLIRLTDLPLSEAQHAPNAAYTQVPTAIDEGDVLIFAIRDGKHFGKFEVLDIIVGAEERERALADLARQPLE